MYQMFQEAAQRMQPWIGAGSTAVGQIGGLLGLPGYTALDPTSVLRATPGYEWLQGQGMEGLSRAASARGMDLSGAQQKGLTDWNQNLALTRAWNPYMTSLTDLSKQGLSGAGMVGGWGTQTGQNLGQAYMAGSQAQAEGLVNSALADAQSGGGMFRDIMSGLGLFGGLAAPSLMGSAFGLGGTAARTGAGTALNTAPLAGPTFSSLPSWGSSYGGWLSGLRQAGGPVSRMGQYVVGERGPEVFVPRTDGYIVPNHLLPWMRRVGYAY